MQYVTMLGRQPEIGMAELERIFDDVRWFSNDAALVNSDSFDIERLGGTTKAGRVVARLDHADWRKASMALVRAYHENWSRTTHKITVGISAYGFKVSPRDVQRTGLILKSKLKHSGVSMRLIPNEQSILSTATAHHNKLGLSPHKIELMVIRGHGGNTIIAESIGSQNITALARRDQGRPARDAFVGMLPPKLAMIMANLGVGDWEIGNGNKVPTVLDPFCGTGVVLQEAALLGYDVYGTDLSDKMIDYSKRNLDWLFSHFNISVAHNRLHQADAMTATWQQPIDTIVCETYLGQPFSAPPSDKKLEEVRRNCDRIVSEFLRNIGTQIDPGTSLCIAVPAWNDGNDNFTHLPLIKKLTELGYTQVRLKNVSAKELLYYRPGQVVARELLILQKK